MVSQLLFCRCNDGEPLPADDQTYVVDNVLNYHPDKAAKIGAGIDFITVCYTCFGHLVYGS